MGDTKIRLRITDAEVEVNGRVGRLQHVALEASFDDTTPHVLGDLLALFGADRRELEHLRAQVTDLQHRATAMVEERRSAARAAEGKLLATAEGAFEAGRDVERRKRNGRGRP